MRRHAPIAILSILLGGIIIVCSIESGIHRWEDPAWYYAAMVPGSPLSWGVVILDAGVLILAGIRWPILLRAGYVLAFTWFCFMSAAAAMSTWHDLTTGTREADPVGVISWGALGYWCRASYPPRRPLT